MKTSVGLYQTHRVSACLEKMLRLGTNGHESQDGNLTKQPGLLGTVILQDKKFFV